MTDSAPTDESQLTLDFSDSDSAVTPPDVIEERVVYHYLQKHSPGILETGMESFVRMNYARRKTFFNAICREIQEDKKQKKKAASVPKPFYHSPHLLFDGNLAELVSLKGEGFLAYKKNSSKHKELAVTYMPYFYELYAHDNALFYQSITALIDRHQQLHRKFLRRSATGKLVPKYLPLMAIIARELNYHDFSSVLFEISGQSINARLEEFAMHPESLETLLTRLALQEYPRFIGALRKSNALAADSAEHIFWNGLIEEYAHHPKNIYKNFDPVTLAIQARIARKKGFASYNDLYTIALRRLNTSQLKGYLLRELGESKRALYQFRKVDDYRNIAKTRRVWTLSNPASSVKRLLRASLEERLYRSKKPLETFELRDFTETMDYAEKISHRRVLYTLLKEYYLLDQAYEYASLNAVHCNLATLKNDIATRNLFNDRVNPQLLVLYLKKNLSQIDGSKISIALGSLLQHHKEFAHTLVSSVEHAYSSRSPTLDLFQPGLFDVKSDLFKSYLVIQRIFQNKKDFEYFRSASLNYQRLYTHLDTLRSARSLYLYRLFYAGVDVDKNKWAWHGRNLFSADNWGDLVKDFFGTRFFHQTL